MANPKTQLKQRMEQALSEGDAETAVNISKRIAKPEYRFMGATTRKRIESMYSKFPQAAIAAVQPVKKSKKAT